MNYMENYYVIIQKQISSLEIMNQVRPEHLAYLKEVNNYIINDGLKFIFDKYDCFLPIKFKYQESLIFQI